MATTKAIPQAHKGTVYRSRTEARWAEFFRLTNTPFQYEPEGYQLGPAWYVPDFWLPDGHAFVEVKGTHPTLPERHKASLLARQSECPVVITAGNPSETVACICFWPDGETGSCVFVEEHKADSAWAAQFADGGGWSFPLSKGLVNCAAYGRAHPALEAAGKLQFQSPLDLEPDPPPPLPDRTMGDWEQAGHRTWGMIKTAWQRKKDNDKK